VAVVALALGIGANAADQAPEADTRAIVRKSLEHESLDMDPPRQPDYTYLLEEESQT
jgi:hypothetical protein